METKVCTKCGRELPATAEYFYRSKATKDGLWSYCKACNREAKREERHEYYEAHKEERKEKYNSPKWKKYRKEYMHEYHLAHYSAEKRRQKYEESGREYAAKWYNENRERVLDYSQKKRMKARGCSADLSLSQWEDTKEYFGYRCAYCGRQMINFIRDHIIPVKHGGAYTKSNIIPACQRCNSLKSARSLSEWYPKQSFYSPEREAKILEFIKEASETDKAENDLAV